MFSVVDRTRVSALKVSKKCSDEQLNDLFDDRLNHLRLLTLDSMNVLTVDSIISRNNLSNRLESLFIWFDDNQYPEKLSATSEWIFKICLSNLKSLKYLSIRKCKGRRNPQPFHSFPSRSIPDSLSCQHLYFTTVCVSPLEVILSRLPNLRTLNSVIKLNPSTCIYPKMIYLHKCKLTLFHSTNESLVHFLKHCPNLQRLSLTINNAHIDTSYDQQWQYIIEFHLPQLKQLNIDSWTKPLASDVATDLCTTICQKNSFWQERKTCVTILEQKAHSLQLVQTHINIKFNIDIK